MTVEELELPGLLLITPTVHRDARGSFHESWNARRYAEQAGLSVDFVQDNLSRSRRGVVRGLHYQHPGGQAKLASVPHGEVWDVAVDLRRGSPTFGRWAAATLSAENGCQLYIPEGFAHGFAVLSEDAVFAYKCSDFYDSSRDRTLRWDDPAIGIRWPVERPVLSERDAAAPTLGQVGPELLPAWAPVAPVRAARQAG